MAEAVSGTSKVPWDLRDLKYQGKVRLQKLGDSELRALCEERGITLEQDHTGEDYVRALLAWKAVRSAAVSVTKPIESEESTASAGGGDDSTTVDTSDVRWDLGWWSEEKLNAMPLPKLRALCGERHIDVKDQAQRKTCVEKLLAWKKEIRGWKEETLVKKGRGELREMCGKRHISVKDGAHQKTCVSKLLAWRNDGPNNSSDTNTTSEADGSKNNVEVPWNLKSWGEERLKKKMDVIMLREMCAVRSIELPSDRPRKQTCITKLMEWKKGYDKMAPEQNQTQAKAPAKKKAKTDNWEPKLGWPTAHDQASSYCGNMPSLISYYEEKNLSTSGGMKPDHVKKWLKNNPDQVPEWLRRLWNDNPKKVSVDHIIPDKLGGHPWPHNYFLMPSDDNSHFNASVEKEKKKYVGAAYETASSFARWVRDAARARIDYSRFDPVDARFIGRA